MNNKTTLSLLGGALLSGAAFAGTPAVAPEPACEPCFEANVYVGYHSDYIWRGTQLGTDMIDAGVEISKSAFGLDFVAGAWNGSFESGNNELDELNLYLDATKDFGFASLTAGYIYYNTDTGADNFENGEFYFGVSKDLFFGIGASYVYFLEASGETTSDEGDNDGYSVLSLSKECCLIDGVTWSNDLGYYVEKGQLGHNTLSATYDYAITDNATISPYLAYNWDLDHEESDDKNRFYGGVSLSVSF